MNVTRATALLVGLPLLALPLLGAASAQAAPVAPVAPVAPAQAAADPTGLPAGVPDAALRAEPSLPAPAAWPFGEEFSRTSGTGRLAGGAHFWTDWLYDDHGASLVAGLPTSPAALTSNLAPTNGVYAYPAGPASGNGADVFRSAVGVDDTSSYWRVDWNTLVDPDVPLAVWGLDTDDDAATGSADWPASAGVSSPGVDRFLVVSAAGAQLLDDGGDVVASVPTSVDLDARSFVVAVPRAVLPLDGEARVRLVSGLADAAGTGLATPTLLGPLPVLGLPRVYNASYRTIAQEPPVFEGSDPGFVSALAGLLSSGPLATAGLDGPTRFVTGNYWMEDAQATALAAGDVEDFSQLLDWSALEAGTTEPEPRPSGYSNRWYVSGLDLGQGVVENTSPQGDLQPNYLGRVQPYAVQVPEGVEPGAPLTFVLHSLGVNHNQYGGLNPQTLEQLCDDRGSVCATTLGHGPDLWYFDEAEVDFWSVWREVAETYRTSTERTVIGGYSMGGWAAWKLGLAHSDLFARAFTLAGPPTCGIQVASGVRVPADMDPASRCAADGVSAPLLENARWLPFVIAQGGIDMLVPVTSVLEQVQSLQALGQRHALELYPAEDHLGYATRDRFATSVASLGGAPAREVDPGRVTHAWFGHLDDPALGIGATTAHWLVDLQARDSSPGVVSRVDATSLAIPDPVISTRAIAPTTLTSPSPGVRTGLEWDLGATPAAEQRLLLDLTGVQALTVDARRAGLTCGAAVAAVSDGATALTLTGLPAGASLSPGSGTTAALPAGESELAVVCAAGAGGVVPVAAPRRLSRLRREQARPARPPSPPPAALPPRR